MIELGYRTDDGEPFEIPVKHTVLTGITRHGKSETMKAMADRVEELGYTVLIFDVKPQRRDYDDIGHDVPVYLEQAADPRTLRRLLENVGEMSMSYQFAELVKLYEEGDGYADILERIDEWLEEGRHPVQEDKLYQIQYLLRELVEDLDRVEITESLELEDGINVMDLSGVERSVQQLAVSSTAKEVLDHREDVIVCIDEASRFIPQNGNPPANKQLVRMIKEGAAKGVWLWIADQTVTGVDKDPLKQVDVWIFGRQREQNEVDRVRDQVGKSNYSDADVKEMAKGHFIVDLETEAPMVYVRPVWMDDETARGIARGDQEIEDEPEPEDMTDIEDELAEKQSEINDLESQLQDAQATIEEQRGQIEKLERLLEAEEDEAPAEAAPAGVAVDEDRVRSIIEEYVEEVEAPGEVAVEATQTKLVVRRETGSVTAVADESDPMGLIAYYYATGEIPAQKWMTTGNIEDTLESKGYDVTVRRTGILDDFCKMGLAEMKWSGNRKDYQFKMPPDIAEAEGLLEYDEVPA